MSKFLKKYILVIIPIAIVLVGNILIPINVIYYDEIVPIAFVNNAFNFSTPNQILFELFSPHHEHILVIIKLLYSLNYLLNKSIYLPELMLWGTLFQILFLLQLNYYLKLSWKALSIFSMTIFLPYFQDLYYHSMSLNNILINIFIFQSLVCLSKGKQFLSLIFLILALFDSAQSYLFLPIWVFTVLYFQKNKFITIIPILLFIGIYFITRINKPTETYSITSNILSLFNNPRAWGYLCPPFNESSIYIQLIGLLLFVYMIYHIVKNASINFCVKTYVLKNLIPIGFLIYSSLCFTSVFIMRNILMPRYFIYSAINFSIIFFLFTKLKSRKIWLENLILTFTIISFLILCNASIIPLKNYYLEKRLILENYSFNKSVNYFPTESFRAELGKTPTAINRKFDIPNGINGSIESHLKVFNDFIPVSLILLPVNRANNIYLKIRNLKSIKKIVVDNAPNENQIKKIFSTQYKDGQPRAVYYLKCKSSKNVFYFPLTEDKNHSFKADVFSNQLPYGKINVSVMKGYLSLK